MMLKDVLKHMKFNGHVVLMINGIPVVGGMPDKVIRKYGYYEITYSCISDGVLVISIK